MSSSKLKMLVISPHPDDSIIAVGGAIARFIKYGGEVTVLTISAHMPPLYTEEAFRITIDEARLAHLKIGVKNSIFLNYAALSLARMEHHELNNCILGVLHRVRPQILLIPFLDRHIDHRAVFESAMVASRSLGPKSYISLIAAYEVLSSTNNNAPYIEPNFVNNWVVDISDFIDIKLDALKGFKSQIKEFPHQLSIEAIRALALFRGSQVGIAYGEGLSIIRMTIPPELLLGTNTRNSTRK
ncbi:MAG: PIG-L deacetylase family protein [Candidatus Hatepunaea meridiana]|nr:PIG-L deacetylase family protein [Candidatus Hatepunaea meridiana]